jgi:hypothetical protein
VSIAKKSQAQSPLQLVDAATAPKWERPGADAKRRRLGI